ncbi:unnamed protein product, partial [Rotaria sp. Silwood2]
MDTIDSSNNPKATLGSSETCQNLPITGICIVSRPNNAPTGYHCIRKTYDDPLQDADLIPDSILERRSRFLCITRHFPLAKYSAIVLQDIRLIDEDESHPPNYVILSDTIDTKEKGTIKCKIAVKMIPREAGMKSINDIIFLYRTKTPPSSYCTIGKINGLCMCIRDGIVPPMIQALDQTIPTPFNNSE